MSGRARGDREQADDDEKEGLALLSVSARDASSSARRALFLSAFFPPYIARFPSLGVSSFAAGSREGCSPRGRATRRPAGDKSRISCFPAVHSLGRRLRRRRVGGGNLSLADDPLKRIRPRSRQMYATTLLRAATREVIQRHATRPTRHVRPLM